jgi:hypothetical protein
MCTPSLVEILVVYWSVLPSQGIPSETLFSPTTTQPPLHCYSSYTHPANHVSMVITTTPVVNFNNLTQTLHSIPYSDWTHCGLQERVCLCNNYVSAPLLICGLALTFLRLGWWVLWVGAGE